MTSAVGVVGVGGAGGRIVGKANARLGGQPPVAVVNTDARELDAATAAMKLQIGMTRTGGLGTGGIPGAARLAAEDDIATLRELMRERELVLAVAGLGGGTGSGALPTVLRAAADAGAVTVAVVTLPFPFEGPQRADVAREALREIQEVADTVVVIEAARLLEATGEAPVERAFEQADDLVGASLATLCRLLTQPGYIKLDLADLKALASQSGDRCTLAYGEADGVDRARMAAERALRGILTEGGRRVASAGALLVGIVGGPDLTLSEVGELMAAVDAVRAPECRVWMGTHIDPDATGRVSLAVFVAETFEAAPTARTPGSASPAVARGGKRADRARGAKSVQPTLALGIAGRGRFRNVEPTILDGEDLDVPTFMRRGLRIEP